MPFLVRAAGAIAQQWPWFWPCVAGVFGAVMGSFAGCMAYRLRRGLPLRQPPSHCGHCRATLTVADLVPVFSYLALRGRCRHCGRPIGAAALGVESVLAAVFALAAWLVQRGF
jgi:prepilin signal peptidase PulO-like enzyme (type II secretory pathway)